MTRQELKKRLGALLDALPSDKAELVLEFADSLRREFQTSSKEPTPGDELSAWEQELAVAEDYWFACRKRNAESTTVKWSPSSKRRFWAQTVMGRLCDRKWQLNILASPCFTSMGKP